MRAWAWSGRSEVGGVRDLLAADGGQGVHRGLLLGFLLVRAPRRRVVLPGNLGRHLEALVVVRPLLVEDAVLRRVPALPLGHLLQDRLEVPVPVAGGVLDFGGEV